MNTGNVIQNNGLFDRVFDNIKYFFLPILGMVVWFTAIFLATICFPFYFAWIVFTDFYMKTTNIAKKIRKLLLDIFTWLLSLIQKQKL